MDKELKIYGALTAPGAPERDITTRSLEGIRALQVIGRHTPNVDTRKEIMSEEDMIGAALEVMVSRGFSGGGFTRQSVAYSYHSRPEVKDESDN